jgi:hypothetical protein
VIEYRGKIIGAIIPIVVARKTKPPRKAAGSRFTGQRTVPGIHSQVGTFPQRAEFHETMRSSFIPAPTRRIAVRPDLPIGETGSWCASYHPRPLEAGCTPRGLCPLRRHRAWLPCFPRRPKHAAAHVTPASPCTVACPGAAGKQALNPIQYPVHRSLGNKDRGVAEMSQNFFRSRDLFFSAARRPLRIRSFFGIPGIFI